MKLLLFILLYSVASWAQNSDTTIANILEKGVSLSPMECPTTSSYSSCINVLCPQNIISPEVPVVKATVDKETEQEITKLINSIVESKKQDVLKSKKAFEAEDEKTLFFRIEASASMFFQSFAKPSVDLSKPLGKRVTFKLEGMPTSTKPEVEAAAKSWVRSFNELPMSQSSLLGLGAYTPKEMMELLKKNRALLEKDQVLKERIKTYNSKLISDITDFSDFSDQEKLKGILGSFEMFMSPPSMGMTGSGQALCLDDCLTFVKKIVISEEKAKFDLQTDSLNDEKKDNLIKSCLHKGIITDSYLQKLKQIEAAIPEVKESVVKSFNKICPSYDDLSKFMSSIKIGYDIDNKARPFDDVIKALKASQVKSAPSFLTQSEYSLTKDIEEICKFNGDFIADSWDVRVNTVFLSPVSVLQERGIGIIMHELGHSAASFINGLAENHSCRTSYEKVRSCISGRQRANLLTTSVPTKPKKTFGLPMPGPIDLYPKFAKDTSFSEEDMADYISAISMKTNPNGPTSCVLTKHIDDEYELPPREAMSSTDNKHSAGVARLLWEIIDQGKEIPNECRPLMKEMSDYSWEKCL